MLTQVDWNVNGLHCCFWPETDFPQHTYCMEPSPSTLDLWELVDPMAPSETLFAQARSMPINYNEKVLSIRQTGSSGHT